MDVSQIAEINAATISNDLLQEKLGKSDKQIENKENYIKVECPWIIQAAIGGDLDIFNYLLDHGANVNSYGHITLSRKNKNSVISNVLGAAVYFGSISLVHYILEKHPNVDKNFKCSEKKAKIKQFSQVKEFNEFAPVHLAIVSDIAEEDTIEILKLLNQYKAKFDLTDSFKNNILHLAVKYNKFRVVKYIVEDLKLNNLVSDLNKEGQTPLAINDQNPEITNYLQQYLNTKDNFNELLELFENSKIKNQQKGKKKKNQKGEFLINSSEFQETLKLPPSKPIVETPVEKQDEETSIRSETKNRENSISNKSNENEENTSIDNIQHYERRSYHNEKNYRPSGNYYKRNYDYNYRGYNKGYDNYYKNENYRYGDKYYDKKDYNSQGYGKKRYFRTKDENETFSTSNIDKNDTLVTNGTVTATPQQNAQQTIQQNSLAVKNNLLSETSNNIRSKNEIIGLSKPKKSKKEKTEIPEKVEIIQKEPVQAQEIIGSAATTTQVVVENETRTANLVENHPKLLNDIEENEIEDEDFLREEEHDTKPREELEVVNTKLDVEKEESQNNQIQQEQEQVNNIPEEENINNDQNEKSEQDQQIEVPIEDVERKEEVSVKLNDQSKLTNFENLKKITSKCLNLERDLEKERQQKMEIERYLLKTARNTQQSKITIGNTEENILDLLALANEELERKSKLIYELQSKIEYLEGNNLESMNENQLNQLKNFYGSKLSSIVSAISNLNNFK